MYVPHAHDNYRSTRRRLPRCDARELEAALKTQSKINRGAVGDPPSMHRYELLDRQNAPTLASRCVRLLLAHRAARNGMRRPAWATSRRRRRCTGREGRNGCAHVRTDADADAPAQAANARTAAASRAHSTSPPAPLRPRPLRGGATRCAPRPRVEPTARSAPRDLPHLPRRQVQQQHSVKVAIAVL